MVAGQQHTDSGQHRVLVVGAAGGVGSATLALLRGHALGQALLAECDELLLFDRERAREHVRVPDRARWLEPGELRDGEGLAALISTHEIDEVIELAAVGTWDCVVASARQGASYLTTTYDTWDGPAQRSDPDDARTMLRARALLDPPEVDAGTHLIGAGMNPGLINVLVAAALRELSARSGKAASLAGLDLHSILFTEIDRTRVPDAAQPGPEARFCSTWCPEGCLDEVLEIAAMMTVAGEPRTLDHAPHEARYQARCGDETTTGYLVPHEELVTLGVMYPSVELAYIYQLPPAACASLAAAPGRRPEQWATERLYPPDHLDTLEGGNRLGVLLCSRSLGELWMGWDTPVEAGRGYGTNATLLQVAAGVLAGWTNLRRLEPGVWLPEGLDSQATRAMAEQILGPPRVIWDRDAPLRRLEQRRVS